MSFPGPGHERANRKQLLEQLEEKKKLLRMQAQHTQGSGTNSCNPGTTLNLSSTPSNPTNNGTSPNILPPVVNPTMPSNPANVSGVSGSGGGREVNRVVVNPLTASSYDAAPITPAQRAALQHAHANSVGYFIPQDSSFGNLILPVIPRFDVK
ncbi:putative protein TPRXL [Argonauta hians]